MIVSRMLPRSVTRGFIDFDTHRDTHRYTLRQTRLSFCAGNSLVALDGTDAGFVYEWSAFCGIGMRFRIGQAARAMRERWRHGEG